MNQKTELKEKVVWNSRYESKSTSFMGGRCSQCYKVIIYVTIIEIPHTS